MSRLNGKVDKASTCVQLVFLFTPGSLVSHITLCEFHICDGVIFQAQLVYRVNLLSVQLAPCV